MRKCIPLAMTVFIAGSFFFSGEAGAADVRPLKYEYSYGEVAAAYGNSETFVICDDCPAWTKLSTISVFPPARIPFARLIAVRAPEAQPAVEDANRLQTQAPAVARAEAPPPTETRRPICATCPVTVYFRFGKSDISEFEAAQLKQISGCLAAQKLPVRVDGYTCAVGGQIVNDRLAAERARAVAAYLTAKGVNIVMSDGKGKRGYVSDIHRLNRRVVIKTL